MTSETESVRVNALKSWRFGRAAMVAAFVTIVGPPIGALALLLTPVGYGLGSPFDTEWTAFAVWQALQTYAELAGFAVFYSYILGTPPALISGLALGSHVYRGDGAVSLKHAVVTAMAAVLVSTMAFRLIPRSGNKDTLGVLVMMLPAAIASSVFCWWLMRKIGLIRRTVATSLAKP